MFWWCIYKHCSSWTLSLLLITKVFAFYNCHITITVSVCQYYRYSFWKEMLLAPTVDILIWMFMLPLLKNLHFSFFILFLHWIKISPTAEDESWKNKVMMTAEHISKQATMKETMNREAAVRFCSITTVWSWYFCFFILSRLLHWLLSSEGS